MRLMLIGRSKYFRHFTEAAIRLKRTTPALV